MQVFVKDLPAPVDWAAGIPQNNNDYYEGDYKMVENWNDLGFIKSNPDGSYYQQERNDEALGPQGPPVINPPKEKKKK
jgi:hypothetical protein